MISVCPIWPRPKKWHFVLAGLLLASCASPAPAPRERAPQARAVEAGPLSTSGPIRVPRHQERVLVHKPITVAFSPRGGATDAVVEAIGEAKHSVRMGAYSFTSKPIAQALVAAHKRGVDVQAILDKTQRTQKYSGATFLVNAGIPTHIDARHAIFHNKFLIIDGQTVVTGSFNFSAAAQNSNAENVIVLRNNADIARQYSANWKLHWNHSENYVGPVR